MLNLTRRFLCCLALFSFAGTANGGESIAYRLSEWKQTHFNDVGEAEQHLASVKKLGCEAKIDSHAGHSDVVYRASRWNSMEVATDKLAHEWENWLKSAGFETIHGHVADRVAARSQDDGHDQSTSPLTVIRLMTTVELATLATTTDPAKPRKSPTNCLSGRRFTSKTNDNFQR